MNPIRSRLSLSAIIAGLTLVLTAQSVVAVQDGVDTVIVPYSNTQPFDLADTDDFFASSPTYEIDNPRQTVLYNDWGGNTDFSAKVRSCWTANGIYLRFDIVDDIHKKPSSGGTTEPDGDYIQVNLAHLTCGPDRLSRDPWSLTLMPDLNDESCEVVLSAKSTESKRKIGNIKNALSRTIDGYSITIQLPYNYWDDLPRSGGTTRFQVTFGDSDEAGQINHRFLLFPADRGATNLNQNTTYFGTVRYAKSIWVAAYPDSIVNFEHSATFMVDAGNLTEKELEVSLYLEDKKSGKTAEADGVPRAETFFIPANSQKQHLPIDFDLEGLPSGTYRVVVKAEVFYDSIAFVVRYNAKNGVTYCPDLIERRRKYSPRALDATKNRNSIEETFRHIAGGGKVLWSAGAYDASSSEFPQYIRELGSHEIELPAAQATDVPWALFGGLDTLDGMNEPLVLKIPSASAMKTAPFQPDDPLLQSKKNPGRAVRDRINYLLLIGLTMDYIGQDSLPEIRIASNSRGFVQQKLMPRLTNKRGSRHSYVYRLWLTGTDSEVSIENVNQHGHRVEIDFMALLGGGDSVAFQEGTPSISFTGEEQVRTYNKMLPVSLHFLKNYMVDSDGNPHSSLPGGYYDDLSIRDWGLLLSELSIWGNTAIAESLIKNLPIYFGSTQYRMATGKFDIGYATVITGVYNLWRKSGKNKALLDPIWLSTIHRPMTAFVKEIDTNPLGLVNCLGDFGVSDSNNLAATVPMYFAVRSAIGAAVEMAKESGYGENAVGWGLAADRFYHNFRRNLVSPESQIQLVSQDTYPGGWGIDEQIGVVALLPQNAWLYGRHEKGKPVLYDRDIRLFDTPHLLSGIGFWTDFDGFELPTNIDDQLQASYDYILGFSPLFRKPAWSKYYVVDYNSSLNQLWTILAGLYLDSIPIATNTLDSFIKYSFDEYRYPGPDCDIKISPFTFADKLNLTEEGQNPGTSYDDLNVLNGTLGLKVARVIAGVDDHDARTLRLIPRLPDRWQKIDVKNWLIANEASDSKLSTITYSYDRIADGKYSLILDSSQKLDSVSIRLGPFPAKVRKVRIFGGGQRSDVNTVRHGFYSWAEQTYKKVKSIEISAQSIIY